MMSPTDQYEWVLRDMMLSDKGKEFCVSLRYWHDVKKVLGTILIESKLKCLRTKVTILFYRCLNLLCHKSNNDTLLQTNT